MAQLTEGDLANFEFFLRDKGDLTRWSKWEELKPIFFATYPHLKAAMANLEAAKFVLENTVKDIVYDGTTN